MTHRLPQWFLATCSALVLACSGGGNRDLRVGHEPPAHGGGSAGGGSGSNQVGDGGIASGNNALSVRVEDLDKLAIDVITLACAGDCADVEAVAHGGNPPYAIRWEDGSSQAKRHVCLDASKTLSVSATDTAISDSEFHYDARTVHADVTATVLACGDGGVAADGGGVAPSVYWTTWTSVTEGKPGSGAGVISPPGGDVSVIYAGEVAAGSAITGQPSVNGVATVTFTPESTYLSNTVTNAPPASGLIGVYGDATLTQTVTFSVPVRDPVLAVVSLGNFGVPTTWTFDAAPTVLSTGIGLLNQNGSLDVSDKALIGAEGNGVVQLVGTFSAISFTATSTDFAAFTVGIHGRR